MSNVFYLLKRLKKNFFFNNLLLTFKTTKRFLSLTYFYTLNFFSFFVWKISNINKKILVIELPYGGLGDHLFYSRLPRIAKEKYTYDKVFISRLSKIRRKEHYKIIWGLNPFVDGECYSHGKKIRDILPEADSPLKTAKKSGKNILDLIKIEYELDDFQRFDNPEIFYKPKLIEKYKDKTIFDPNFVSDLHHQEELVKIKKYFLENNITVDYQFPAKKKLEILNICNDFIYDKDFYEYIDIIFSCKKFYCFASGSAVISVAIGKSANVFYNDKVDLGFLFTNKNKYIKY